MKRSEQIASLALVPLDFLALIGAAWIAFEIRRWEFVTGFRPLLFNLRWQDYLQTAVVVALIWMAIFAAAGLYKMRSTDTPLVMFGRIFFACAAGFVSITVLVFLRGELFSSRFIILVAWLIAIANLTLVRLLVRLVQRQLFKHGYASHRVLVVGQGHLSETIVNNIKLQPELGYVLVNVLAPTSQSLILAASYIKDNSIDEILFIDAESTPGVRQQFIDLAEEYHIVFRYAPDLLLSTIAQPEIELDLGTTVIELPETTLTGWGRIIKRLIDILGSSGGLLLLSPVYLLLAILIWLDSGRPIIFKSQRIGRGRPFVFYKFRTMKLEYCIGPAYGGEAAEKFYTDLINSQNYRQGPVPKIINDPRFTRLGRTLRQYSLDELPQLWNILKGDMSLVGPRPHLPREVANYQRHHKKVLAIKPGLTGLAQVSGRSDLDFDEEVRLDRYYIEHWSFWLDIRILLKTGYTIFKSRRTV